MIGNNGIFGITKGPGYKTVNKWGEQIDVDTADATVPAGQKIWPIKRTVQDYIFLDAAIQLSLKSTSEDDTILGSGAQKVNVLYQTTTEEKEIELDMDGSNLVDLPDLSVGSFRLNITQSGAGNTNAGQIQIVDGSANIYATIEVGEGQSQIAVYRIPDNKKGKIKSHKTDYARTAPAANSAQMRLRVRQVSGTIITKWDPTISTDFVQDNKDYFIGGIDLNPGEWIFWECITVSANGTPLRASFDIELEDIT
jgi:hypothetical protein